MSRATTMSDAQIVGGSGALRRREAVCSDLRHTAASLAVSAGANVKAVQGMLGNASAAMTLDVYADLFNDDMDALADAVNSQAITQSVGKLWAVGTEKVAQSPSRNEKTPGCPGVSLVAPTGIDPVTFRFSVERSTN